MSTLSPPTKHHHQSQTSLPRSVSAVFSSLSFCSCGKRLSTRQLMTSCHYFPVLTPKNFEEYICGRSYAVMRRISGVLKIMWQTEAACQMWKCLSAPVDTHMHLPFFFLSFTGIGLTGGRREKLGTKRVNGSTYKPWTLKISVGNLHTKQRWVWTNGSSKTTCVGVKLVFTAAAKRLFTCEQMSR